jgi:preprotein translocase subunit YajC
MIDFFMLIAQATTQPAPQPALGDTFWRVWFPLLLFIGVFYFFLFRGPRKERQRHADMLKNLKRNDRVQTIGGVLGIVVDVRDQEVVLKVDETSNVKMRFNRSAIKEVLAATEPSQ